MYWLWQSSSNFGNFRRSWALINPILFEWWNTFWITSWHILDSAVGTFWTAMQLARCSQWLKLLISHIFISCLLKGFVYYRTSRLLHLYHPSTKQLRAFEMFIHLLRILESLSVFHTEIFEHNAEATIISTFSSSSSARSGDWVVDFWCWRFVCLETYTSFFLLYFLCSFEMVHG